MFEKSQNLYREKPFQGQKNNSVDYCAADLFIGMTTEGPGFCFCLVVFHVSDGVGVNLFTLAHSAFREEHYCHSGSMQLLAWMRSL